MRLIVEKCARTDKYDRLRFVRNNGSQSEALMPRQGILPHDLVHYVVESALPIKHGFLSLVARGADVQAVMDAVHDPENSRVETEAMQVEAIVEGLQSQLWAGSFDLGAFLDGAASACAARDKPPYDFSTIDIKASLFDRALDLNQQWNAVPYFGSLSLEFQARPL